MYYKTKWYLLAMATFSSAAVRKILISSCFPSSCCSAISISAFFASMFSTSFAKWLCWFFNLWTVDFCQYSWKTLFLSHFPMWELFLLHLLLLEQRVWQLDLKSDLQGTFLPFFSLAIHSYMLTYQRSFFSILKYFQTFILIKDFFTLLQIYMLFSPFLLNSAPKIKIQGEFKIGGVYNQYFTQGTHDGRI